MKLYIDSRRVSSKKYNTLLEVFCDGKCIVAGIMERAAFCVIDLEQTIYNDLKLKFSLIKKDERKNYVILEACDVTSNIILSEFGLNDEFFVNSPEEENGREDRFVPKEWIYAYSTHILNVKEEYGDIIFVFNEKRIEDVAICEVHNEKLKTIYERNVENSVLTKSFDLWLIKWILLELTILFIGIGLFALSLLIIGNLKWSIYESRAEACAYGISAFIFLLLPNGGNIMVLKETLKNLKKLKQNEYFELS